MEYTYNSLNSSPALVRISSKCSDVGITIDSQRCDEQADGTYTLSITCDELGAEDKTSLDTIVSESVGVVLKSRVEYLSDISSGMSEAQLLRFRKNKYYGVFVCSLSNCSFGVVKDVLDWSVDDNEITSDDRTYILTKLPDWD